MDHLKQQPNQSGKGRADKSARQEIIFSDDEVDISDFHLIDLPGLIALWGLAIIVFLQFFTRYVLNDSLAWTEEIARYVLIVVAYFGAISVTRKGTHIFLEFFYRYLAPLWGKYLAIVIEALSLVFYSYLAYQAVILAQKTRTKMASVEIPKSLLYWGVAVSLAIAALFSLMWLIRKIKQSPDDVMRELEQHSHNEI